MIELAGVRSQGLVMKPRTGRDSCPDLGCYGLEVLVGVAMKGGNRHVTFDSQVTREPGSSLSSQKNTLLQPSFNSLCFPGSP